MQEVNPACKKTPYWKQTRLWTYLQRSSMGSRASTLKIPFRRRECQMSVLNNNSMPKTIIQTQRTWTTAWNILQRSYTNKTPSSQMKQVQSRLLFNKFKTQTTSISQTDQYQSNTSAMTAHHPKSAVESTTQHSIIHQRPPRAPSWSTLSRKTTTGVTKKISSRHCQSRTSPRFVISSNRDPWWVLNTTNSSELSTFRISLTNWPKAILPKCQNQTRSLTDATSTLSTKR